MLNAIPSNDPDALVRLAHNLLLQNRPDESLRTFYQALAFQPDHLYALSTASMLLLRFERPADAVSLLRRAIALYPTVPGIHTNLGLALISAKDAAAAVTILQKSIQLDPADPTAWNNLGLAQLELRRFHDAAATFRHALANVQPAPNVAILLHINLSTALVGAGLPAAALDAQRAAIALQPHNLQYRSGLLLGLHYLHDISPESLFHEHQLFTQVATLITPLPPITPEPLIDRPVRIGYVSPDFRDHSVAHFIEPILARHDRSRFSITCYSNAPKEDAVTARIRTLPLQWRQITHVSDADAAAQIRADRIDLLVDLAGHTAGNRLPLFALKPAPVQITWLGYPDTTGLPAIDFRLTDDIADPPGPSDKFSTERLIRLPHSFLCYQPPITAPNVAPLPALTNRHITFGTFNALNKLNPPLLDRWAKLLLALPTARLLLKNAGLAAEETQSRLRAAFSARNIDPARLAFLPYADSHHDHLAAYSQIDIALDTSPYNGTTTTCDALWMGVPVITLPGNTHHSRVGASLLTAARLTYLIADNHDHFLQIAADLASDLPALAHTRSRLRPYITGTPLFDPKPFTQNLEQTYTSLHAIAFP